MKKIKIVLIVAVVLIVLNIFFAGDKHVEVVIDNISLTEENQKLEGENRSLRSENAGLRQENNNLKVAINNKDEKPKPTQMVTNDDDDNGTAFSFVVPSEVSDN
jgi:cell division protein FtsB